MRKYWAIGLMSGTSMDGVDAAEIKSDGLQIFEFGNFISIPYTDKFKEKLRELVDLKDAAPEGFVREVEQELTAFHAKAVSKLLKKSGKKPSDIDLIGFHGHTIDHRPHERYTWQIGDGRYLADLTNISVICNFRKNDVLLGGQGAPLIPLFHKAIVDFPFYPAVIINIGGVANITYLSEGGFVAFDTGPGNALMDDFTLKFFNKGYDSGGKIAKSGRVNKFLLEDLMNNIYFYRKPPKSLDRNNFNNIVSAFLADEKYKGLNKEDVLATLTEFTVESIAISFDHLPATPKTIFACGGGVNNKYLIRRLEKRLLTKIFDISVVDANLKAEAIEAQGFGYLAIRSKIGLPITFASTTGVKMSSATGGVFYPA